MESPPLSGQPMQHQSPLRQNPPNPPTPRSSPPSVTQNIFLDYPPARLSSSPASSPRIVDSPPTRRRSVRPEMSDLMEKGVSPGMNFLDLDSADDESDWEDDNGTHTFSDVEGLGIMMEYAEQKKEEEQLRERNNPMMEVLPSFNLISSHNAGDATKNEDLFPPLECRVPKKAHQVSLRRIGQGKVVHNTGSGPGGHITPHDSLQRYDSDISSCLEAHQKLLHNKLESNESKRHRRNTSESVRAESIINAHALTLQAIDSSLHPKASQIRLQRRSISNPSTMITLPKSASLTENRHIRLSHIYPTSHDPNRPAHLPSHFVKTPYPFTARKEFPKPMTRPRVHNIEHDKNAKGKHVLGMASNEKYDLRSRLERNEEAQGITRDQREIRGTISTFKEGIVWVSLKRRRGDNGIDRKLEYVVVPSSLTTTSPGHRKCKKSEKSEKSIEPVTLDFDDQFFTKRLRDAYRNIAGPWLCRACSARKLNHIQLGQVGVWSGSVSQDNRPSMSRLLVARSGLNLGSDALTPFTEENLIQLFRNPKAGKARYTWVHWARRVAASNSMLESSPSTRSTSRSRRRTKSLDTATADTTQFQTVEDYLPVPPLRRQSTGLPDTLVTIQFVHSFSAFKICSVLALSLAMSVLAALLWIFEGKTAWAMPEGRGRAERVNGAMLVGLLALGLEMVGVGAWVWASWRWA